MCSNLPMPHCLIKCKLLVNLFHPTTLSAFAYLTWVIWIIIARSSLCSTLAYTLKRMDPTPHEVMPRSWRMWLKASLTNTSLRTIGVSRKATLNLPHSRFVCFFALATTFCSLWQNWARRLFKTHTFIAM